MKRKLIGIIVLIMIAQSSMGQSLRQPIETLSLHVLKGTVHTRYSDGYKSYAQNIQKLLESSITYFENRFDVHEQYSVAVLNANQWQQISQVPYGLPFVSGPPYVVCLPANEKNVLAESIWKSIDKTDLPSDFQMSTQEIVQRFVSIIGLHELGHIYARAYGIDPPNKWIAEFTATYFAYSYLKTNHPEDAQLWTNVASILVSDFHPRYNSFGQFEELYTRVGVKNYAWFQVVFLLGVKEVYSQQGPGFLEHLSTHNWTSSSDEYYMDEIKNLAPGLIPEMTKCGLVQ